MRAVAKLSVVEMHLSSLGDASLRPHLRTFVDLLLQVLSQAWHICVVCDAKQQQREFAAGPFLVNITHVSFSRGSESKHIPWQ